MSENPRASVGYIGHATVLVDLAGVKLLTDPLLRNRVAHLRRAAKVDARALRGVDAVLISHIHYDHLDLPSLLRLGRLAEERHIEQIRFVGISDSGLCRRNFGWNQMRFNGTGMDVIIKF